MPETSRFIAIDPDVMSKHGQGFQHRGRVSYPLLKMFLESNLYAAQLNREGLQQTLLSLSSSLGAYIRNHKMPIQLMQRGGQIILVRTDMDPDGTMKSVDTGSTAAEAEVKEITPDVITSHATAT